MGYIIWLITCRYSKGPLSFKLYSLFSVNYLGTDCVVLWDMLRFRYDRWFIGYEYAICILSGMSDMWWVSVNNWSSSSFDFTIPPFLVILEIDSNFWPIRKWNQTKRLKFGPLRVFNAPFRAHSGPIGLHCNMGFKLCGKRDLVCHIP